MVVEPKYIGLDIGGTRHNIGLFHKDGRLIDHIEKATDRTQGPSYMIPSLLEAIARIKAKNNILEDEIEKIGIGFGGPVDPIKGTVLRSQHVPGWDNYPLVKIITDKLGIPIILDNDVNAATFGEWAFGAGKNFQDIFYANIGTGIGGGIIAGNQLIRGASMVAGEFGHLKVNEVEPKLCGCGSWGCLEALCSGEAIGKIAQERARVENSILFGKKVKGKDVFKAAAAQDRLALEIIDRTIELISSKIADVVTLLNPSIVIIGGGIIENPDKLFLEPLKSSVKRKAMHEAGSTVEVVKAQNGYLVGTLGAAALAIFS